MIDFSQILSGPSTYSGGNIWLLLTNNHKIVDNSLNNTVFKKLNFTKKKRESSKDYQLVQNNL